MHRRAFAVVTLFLVTAGQGFARDKVKIVLPTYVLQAKTVAVLIDPEAGIAIDDPRANQVAQKDVETALLKWGRFQPVISSAGADLIIVIRRGNGRIVNQTITDPRQNSRPGGISSTDDGLTVGGQHGPPPNGTGGIPGAASGQPADSPHMQTEVGASTDSFLVLDGKTQRPLEGTPAWRYVGRDGLRPHSVPAVEEFRKAILEAEKAASKNP